MLITSKDGKKTLRAFTKDVELDFGEGIRGDRFHTLPFGNDVVNTDEYGKRVLNWILNDSRNVYNIEFTNDKYDTSDCLVSMINGKICKVDVKCRTGKYDTLLIDWKKIIENDYVFIVWLDRKLVECYSRSRVLWDYKLGLVEQNDAESVIIRPNCVIQSWDLRDIVKSMSF